MYKSFAALSFGFALLILAVEPALAVEPGKVEGSLAYKGKRVELEHILVVRYGNEEGTPQGPHLRIFLSDREIPLGLASTVTLYSLRQALHAAGGNAVVLKADPRGRGKKAQVELLSAAELPWPMVETASLPEAFTRLALANRHLSGAATVHSGELEVDAVFDAPVLENAVTASFDGKAARASAPARALIACNAAVGKEDLDALGNCFSDFDLKEVERYRAEIGAKAFAEQAKSRPGAADFARTVRRVVVRGERATVRTGEDFVEMVRENGVWKIKG